MSTITQPRCHARELLREVLGDVVDELSPAQLGRVLGSTFGAAKRELERGRQIPGQLGLDD